MMFHGEIGIGLAAHLITHTPAKGINNSVLRLGAGSSRGVSRRSNNRGPQCFAKNKRGREQARSLLVFYLVEQIPTRYVTTTLFVRW